MERVEHEDKSILREVGKQMLAKQPLGYCTRFSHCPEFTAWVSRGSYRKLLYIRAHRFLK